MDINSVRIIRDDCDDKKVEKSKTQVKRLKVKGEITMGCLKLFDYMLF